MYQAFPTFNFLSQFSKSVALRRISFSCLLPIFLKGTYSEGLKWHATNWPSAWRMGRPEVRPSLSLVTIAPGIVKVRPSDYISIHPQSQCICFLSDDVGIALCHERWPVLLRAINRWNRTGNELQKYLMRGEQGSNLAQEEIAARNTKQNTPGNLARFNTKYKRKGQITYDKFY